MLTQPAGGAGVSKAEQDALAGPSSQAKLEQDTFAEKLARILAWK